MAPVIKSREQRQGNRGVDGTPEERARNVIVFNREIDGDWDRCGTSGNVPRDHERGAEFPQGTRKGKNRSRENSRPRERQSHFAKDAPFARAKRSRRLQEARLNLL